MERNFFTILGLVWLVVFCLISFRIIYKKDHMLKQEKDAFLKYKLWTRSIWILMVISLMLAVILPNFLVHSVRTPYWIYEVQHIMAGSCMFILAIWALVIYSFIVKSTKKL